jgi:hypothetical protein
VVGRHQPYTAIACARAQTQFNPNPARRWRMGESLQHHLAVSTTASAVFFVLAIAFGLI